MEEAEEILHYHLARAPLVFRFLHPPPPPLLPLLLLLLLLLLLPLVVVVVELLLLEVLTPFLLFE